MEPGTARGTLIELFSRNDGDVEIIDELAAAIEREAATLALRRIREGVAGLRELSDAATQGPWRYPVGGIVYGPEEGVAMPYKLHDGPFIVAAVEFVRSLLIDTEIGAEP